MYQLVKAKMLAAVFLCYDQDRSIRAPEETGGILDHTLEPIGCGVNCGGWQNDKVDMQQAEMERKLSSKEKSGNYCSSLLAHQQTHAQKVLACTQDSVLPLLERIEDERRAAANWSATRIDAARNALLDNALASVGASMRIIGEHYFVGAPGSLLGGARSLRRN